MELIGLLHDPALRGPHDVEIVGDYALVAGKWGAFSVVDVSDPRVPRLVGQIAEGVDNAQTILPLDEDVCLLGTNELVSVDLRDSREPRVLARVSGPRIERINGMVRRGTTVYAANKTHAIDVFDVRDPANPVLADVYDTLPGGFVSPHDVALAGDWLVTVDQKKDADLKVRTFRVWEGEGPLPSECWEVASTIDDARLNGANRVDVGDGFAYVACNYGDCVCAIELAETGEMRLRGVADTHDVAPCGIELCPAGLFGGAASHVERFDLSDPSNPTAADRLSVFEADWPRHPKQRGKGDAHDLEWRDGLLYVTGQNDDSLAIVKV